MMTDIKIKFLIVNIAIMVLSSVGGYLFDRLITATYACRKGKILYWLMKISCIYHELTKFLGSILMFIMSMPAWLLPGIRNLFIAYPMKMSFKDDPSDETLAKARYHAGWFADLFIQVFPMLLGAFAYLGLLEILKLKTILAISITGPYILLVLIPCGLASFLWFYTIKRGLTALILDTAYFEISLFLSKDNTFITNITKWLIIYIEIMLVPFMILIILMLITKTPLFKKKEKKEIIFSGAVEDLAGEFKPS